MDKWDNCQDVEQILDNLRINSVNLADYHRKRFYHFKSFGKYFRIPVIVLSSITASASVGLQPVVRQDIISGITCLLGFGVAVISSMEMYLGIQSAMDHEIALSRDYYSLAIDIFKCINLSREHRSDEPKSYLDKKYAEYQALRETSSLLKRKLNVDLLAPIPDGMENISVDASSIRKIPLTKSIQTSTDSLRSESPARQDELFEAI
jgi:hypothetical protein|uniref:VP11 n=1 Tax=viral metagenome TaxID=1070528 RepID=A0A6C0AHD6_9ZZZZ